MNKHSSTYDERLIGTWRSDRRRTLSEWVDARRPTPKLRKVTADIFGHLTLRFTKSRLYSDFKGYRDVQEYTVVASDSDSVAIVHWDSLLEERRIMHIHFEGRHYWVILGRGRNREFFRKLQGATKTLPQTGARRSAAGTNRTSSSAGSRR